MSRIIEVLVKPQLCAVIVNIFTARDNLCEISEWEEHFYGLLIIKGTRVVSE